MVYKLARGKKHTYYKYDRYPDLAIAKRTAKYWNRRNGSRYKITEEWIGGKKYFCLYLTNVMRS